MGMILTDIACRKTEELVADTEYRLFQKHKDLEGNGRTPEEIERLLGPEQGFVGEMMDEVRYYRALREGIFPIITPDQFQRGVVLVRIASGKTQEQFAEMRGVPVEQVQRDERNEYHDLSAREAEQLIRLLGYHLQPVARYEIVKK